MSLKLLEGVAWDDQGRRRAAVRHANESGKGWQAHREKVEHSLPREGVKSVNGICGDALVAIPLTVAGDEHPTVIEYGV